MVSIFGLSQHHSVEPPSNGSFYSSENLDYNEEVKGTPLGYVVSFN